jgi:isopenicillin-N epimerase
VSTPAFGRAIRHEWLLEEGLAHLNHGSFGATPRVVLAAQDRWRLAMERSPTRFFLEDLPGALRAAAGKLAAYVGASADDLVFVDNATTAINAVLRSLPLKAGDELLTTEHVYNAIGMTLDFVAERSGATVSRMKLPFPVVDPGDLLAGLNEAIGPRTRLVLIDHITSSTGLVLPIEDAVALCRERGVPVLVDGAHAPGMLPLDLDRLGADWYTGNPHKWLCAAKGCAFLHVRRDAPDRCSLRPTVISHPYRHGVPEEFDWTGTRDPSAWLSIDAALTFRERLGDEQVRAWNNELCAEAAELLADAWEVELPAPPSMRGSLATIPCPVDMSPDVHGVFTLTRWLRETHSLEPMPVPFGGRMWIRISCQVYNSIDQYERLAQAMLATPFPRAS